MATPADKVSDSLPAVSYDVSEQIATISFNRPEKQNTISGAMLNTLSEYLLKADADNDVRAIIVTGTGRFFCAGLDLRGDSDIGSGLSNQSNNSVNLDLRNTPPTVLHNLDTPTICALNGSAAGYGMDLALGCDIRLMADGAKMAAAFTARGVVPESGGTWILPRLLGWSKAAELIFTGRTLPAAECESGPGNRHQRTTGRPGVKTNDAHGYERELQRPRPPRLPAAAAAVSFGRLPGRHGVFHGEA
jgi:enoyl-CoA hydratase/carnithine racemase